LGSEDSLEDNEAIETIFLKFRLFLLMRKKFLIINLAPHNKLENIVTIREMENLSRGPIFGDFVTIRTEASMKDVTVSRLQSTREQRLPSFLNVM
jgi:hypothetical protein